MPSIRIWTLESDYDAEAVKCLADKLTTHFQVDHLSIRTSGRSELQRRGGRGRTPNESLRKTVQNYLMEDACVIFVIDSDGPMSSHKRRQEPNSLINQVDGVVRDSNFKDRVFHVPAVQELEAWLLIDCLGISCYFARQRQKYKEDCRDKVSQNRSFERLVNRYQKGDTQLIVEAESGGRGAKEFLIDFSEKVLRELNPTMPQRNLSENRYREKMSPDIAEHVVINKVTLRRNKSLRDLGNLLARYS